MLVCFWRGVVCALLVEHMITILDDCYLLGNVVDIRNVPLSITVQQIKSRYAKYVYYSCTTVLCESNVGCKRDREPTRVQMKMLKRLPQKSKKRQSYVRSRLRKNVLKSSKLLQHERKGHTKQVSGLNKNEKESNF